MARRPLIFAAVYAGVSLLTEAAMIVVGRLKVPNDNSTLAPVVLIVPPILASWICGYRRARALILAAAATSLLTLVITMVAGRLTGITTGLALPLVVRFIAGFGGAVVARSGTSAIQAPSNQPVRRTEAP